MASLRGSTPKAQGNRVPETWVIPGEGQGLSGPEVTGVRLETGRSRPGQAEGGGNPAGGPNRGSDVQFVPLTPV